MINEQEAPVTAPRFYAYCGCGVCGPQRARYDDAMRDDRAHAEVCSLKARKP